MNPFTLSLEALTSWSRLALAFECGLLFRTGLVLAAGLAAGVLLRRRGPLTLDLIYRATLASVCACTLLSFLTLGRVPGHWQVALPAQPVSAAEDQAASRAPAASIRWQTETPSTPAAPAAGTNQQDRPVLHLHRIDLYSALAGTWMAGTAALLLWLLACALYVQRLRRRAHCAGSTERALLAELCWEMGISTPELLVSQAVHSPFLTGLRHPAILLPADLPLLVETDGLRAILLHELAHLQRRDCWWGWAARVLCAVLWPQLLLWMVVRQLEHVQEAICDRAVIDWGCKPREYARCLLTLAERMLSTRVERGAGVRVAPLRSSVSQRIRQLAGQQAWTPLNRRTRGAVSSWAAVGAIAGLLLISTEAPGAVPTARPITHTSPASAGPETQARALRHAGLVLPQRTAAPRPAVAVARVTFEPRRVQSTAATPRKSNGRVRQAPAENHTLSHSAEQKPRDTSAAPRTAGESAPATAVRPDRPPTTSGTGRPSVSGYADEPTTPARAAVGERPASQDGGSLQPATHGGAGGEQAQVRPVQIADEDPGPATAAVTGRILDPGGHPLAGVKVSAYPRKLFTSLGKLDHRTARGETITGSDGTYRIEGLQGGLYIVGAISEPTGNYLVPGGQAVTPVPGQTIRADDYRLARAVIVTGTVVDNAGQPLPDLVVSGVRSNPSARPSYSDRSITDGQGRFRLRLGVGTHRVFVYPQQPPGFRGGWIGTGNREFLRDVLLETGKPVEIRFRIDPARLLQWQELPIRPQPSAHL